MRQPQNKIFLLRWTRWSLEDPPRKLYCHPPGAVYSRYSPLLINTNHTPPVTITLCLNFDHTVISTALHGMVYERSDHYSGRESWGGGGGGGGGGLAQFLRAREIPMQSNPYAVKSLCSQIGGCTTRVIACRSAHNELYDLPVITEPPSPH